MVSITASVPSQSAAAWAESDHRQRAVPIGGRLGGIDQEHPFV